MEDLRYHQFMKVAAAWKTTINPQSLAPTEISTKYHSMRFHLPVLNGIIWWAYSWIRWIGDGSCLTDIIVQLWRIWIWNPTIFLVLFDVFVTSPRNVNAVLILTVAKSMVLPVFLILGIVMGNIVKIVKTKSTWMTSVTEKKIEIYLIYLMTEKSRTPKNILWLWF